MGLCGVLVLIPLSTIQAVELELTIEGNRGVSNSRLRTELRPWLEDLAAAPDDPGVREDLLDEVKSIYRKNGYPEAKAKILEQVSTIPVDETRFLLLGVEEGPRAYLERLVVTGNTAFDDEVLEGTFSWLRPGLLPGSRPIYTERAVSSGVAGIRLLYSLLGFLDVEVTTRIDRRQILRQDVDEAGIPDDPTLEIQVKIVVDISENDRTTLDEVVITQGASTNSDVLAEYLGVVKGSPVTPRLLVEVRSRVRRRLQDNGYYRCKVDVQLEEVAPHLQKLTLTVREGAIYTFGGIIVEGNPRTRNGFIRDRLGINFGEQFSASALEEGTRELNRTGLFERFDVQLVPSESDPTQLNLQVAVVERDAIRLKTRFGFSTYELGRFGAGVLHRNLFGLGIEGQLEGLVSFRGEEIEAILRYPYLFDRDISLELRGFYRRFEEISFEREETIASISIRFPVDRRLSLNGGFELRDEDISDVDPAQIVAINESSRAHLIFVGARHDARDSAIDTTRGLLAVGRFEYSGAGLGSDLDFWRVTARGSQTWSFGDSWRLVLASQLGLIERIDEGEIPLGERFFLGGSRTVRSFRQDRMPPRDEFGNEIGGETFFVSSVEVRHPLWGSWSGALFLDGGSLTTELEDFAGKNWRFAAGVGLIWNSPVGPLRVDSAVTLNPEPGDDHWAVHVLLGQPF